MDLRTLVRTHLDALVTSDVRPSRVGSQSIDRKSAERHRRTIWLDIALDRQCGWLWYDLREIGWIFERSASREVG